MTFAKKLRELRDAKGLSEARLADLSGVSFDAIHEYGLGRRRPAFDAVVKLAKALGTDCRAFAECEFPYKEQKPAAARKKPKT